MMSANEFPCPHCNRGLLLDAETAGQTVACPYCDRDLIMPGPDGIARIPGEPDRPRPKTKLPTSRQVSDADAGVAVRDDTMALPPRRSDSKDEEFRRLSAMAGHVDYDVSRMEQKGVIPFACPACNRPLWISRKEFGARMTCDGCSLEIIAPNPTLGLPAQLFDPTQSTAEPNRPRAVLPTQRRVDDQLLREGRPAGKARKQAPPPADTPKPPPPAKPPEEKLDPATPRPKPAVMPKLEPIPAPADPVLRPATPQKTALPSGKASQQRTVGEKSKRPEPAPEPEPGDVEIFGDDAPAADEGASGPKGLLRLSDRRKSFLPKTELEGDLEVTEAWGEGEKKRPVSRRILLISWLLLIPTVLGLGIWGMREVFRQKPEPEKKDTAAANNARTVHVAEEILHRFFSAKTVEEMAQYVRHPDKTLPRMQRYYKRPIPKYQVDSFYNNKEGALDGVDFLTGVLKLDNGEPPRAIALEIPPAGSADPDKLLIDWESYVYWSDVPWDEFRAQEMTTGCDFRVLIKKDDYNNGPFADASKWVSYKIYHPAYHDKDYGYCYGYAAIDSPVCTSMVQPFRAAEERGGDSIQGIVRLRFLAKSGNRQDYAPQVLIEKFTPDWIVVHEE